MIFTPYDTNRLRLNPNGFIQEILEKFINGDTQMIFSKEPIIKEYPKNEGVSYIVDEISNLDDSSTEGVALALKKYTDFMR